MNLLKIFLGTNSLSVPDKEKEFSAHKIMQQLDSACLRILIANSKWWTAEETKQSLGEESN